MGAVTVGAASLRHDKGTTEEIHTTITMSSSYATGGDTYSIGDFGARVPATVHSLQVMPAGGYVFEWDSANGKILAYEAAADGNPLDEVGPATNLGAIVAKAVAVIGQ